jgi:hypothetical protein
MKRREETYNSLPMVPPPQGQERSRKNQGRFGDASRRRGFSNRKEKVALECSIN